METYAQFSKHYWSYSTVVTFNADYQKIHPKKLQDEFKMKIKKYMDKRQIKYHLYPEISKNGLFHYHALFFFYDPNNDYEKHEGVLRLFKNFLHRRFGLSFGWQRVLNFTGSPYPVTDMRFYCKGKTLSTTFKQVYDYITKQQGVYPWLKEITNIQSN